MNWSSIVDPSIYSGISVVGANGNALTAMTGECKDCWSEQWDLGEEVMFHES